MNIHEYQAKQIFTEYGIAIPPGKYAGSVDQARQSALDLGGNEWVVKAQVHAGGRGKAGGVKLVEGIEQLAQATDGLLGTKLITQQTAKGGLPINSVLIEKKTPFRREFYISLLVDRAVEKLVFIASEAGGMDIESVAMEAPEKILTTHINPASGLQSYQCRQIAFALSLKGPQAALLEKVMRGMYRLFLDLDASQVEINPLVETESGDLVALDGKINFDDNALGAHTEIAAMRDQEQEDEKENKAREFDLNYVSLDGKIGCMVNGAGLAMATMDLVQLKGGTPVNFLDVGGGATVERVTEAFKLILSDGNVKTILVNIFGGIVQCNIIAEGIIEAVKQVNVAVPIVVRLEGTNADLGRKLLSDSGLKIIAAEDLETAAEKAVELTEAA